MSKFLLFVSALCCTLYAYASDFMVDGLNYTILSDNEVEVSGFSSASISSPMYKSEILEIPSEVTNKGITYIVTSIGYSAFSVARSGNAGQRRNSVAGLSEDDRQTVGFLIRIS